MRRDSDRRPRDGSEVQIVAPESSQLLSEGTPGEIGVRGRNVMRGSSCDPGATARAIDAAGWLHTGGQGGRLADGFIKSLSRQKDVIRVGGENLSPLEVEEVLMVHPGVPDAAVVAAQHPWLGEVPVAFFVPLDSAATSSVDLHSHCVDQFADFRVRVRFVFVENLPRSSVVAGRVAKVRLREILTKVTS